MFAFNIPGSRRFVSSETHSSNNALKIGLSFISGIGLFLMITAAGISVVGGAEGSALSLVFATGAAMLITGILVWFAVVRPDTHFDDINEPHYHGHHDH